jgi:hypothetical protein
VIQVREQLRDLMAGKHVGPSGCDCPTYLYEAGQQNT